MLRKIICSILLIGACYAGEAMEIDQPTVAMRAFITLDIQTISGVQFVDTVTMLNHHPISETLYVNPTDIRISNHCDYLLTLTKSFSEKQFSTYSMNSNMNQQQRQVISNYLKENYYTHLLDDTTKKILGI